MNYGPLQPYVPSTRRNFAGTHFERWPFLSGISALLRVSRLNYYQSTDYRFAFGMTVRRIDDLNDLMTFSAKRKEQLASALSVPEDIVRSWNLGLWMPFTSSEDVLRHEYRFRYCPACLAYGYHTLLQQAPWIDRCPWHRVRLREDCMRCSKPLVMYGDAGYWLGTCTCGYDHIDRQKSIRGLGSIEQVAAECQRYLAWAKEQRDTVRLIAPVPATRDLTVLRNAFYPPMRLSSDRTGAHEPGLHTVCVKPTGPHRLDTEDAAASFVKLSCLQETRGVIMEAPGALARRVGPIACRLARRLPPASLSDIEMTLFLNPLGVAADRTFVPARRRLMTEIAMLPLRSVGSRSFLDLHCISQVTRQAGHRVLDDFRPVGASATDLYDLLGADQLVLAREAVSEVLARGYSEGIRVVMGRLVPELYASQRDRPHLSEPWIILKRKDGRVASVRIVWARLPRTPE
ncbi:MAG: hypothetical protein JSS44_11355 [Proteobacteria bacterium]|nr:hypothetical protein [Pseudomonadota bacterium]